MKQMWYVLALAIVIVSCGGRKQMSADEIAQKLDSVKAVEVKEKLKLQGVDLETSDNPMKTFYDSLSMQTLPISYSDDFVKFLPGFTVMQPEIASYMNLGTDNKHKAACLPESVGARLVMVADEEKGSDHIYSIWLYSLDDDFMPVDKLCLYATSKEEQKENELAEPEDKLIQDFVITSDYEIRLTDYSGKFEAEVQRVYHVDMSRKFSEVQEIDYEQNGSGDMSE